MTTQTRQKREVLTKAKAEILPSRFTESSLYLQALYTFLKNNLETYSYLEFASDIGFSATNVAFLIIQGRRPLSVKAAKRIQAALDLHGTEGRYFLTLVTYENCKKPQQREDLFEQLVALKNQTKLTQLDRAQLRFFTEWYHPVIRELIGTRDFKSDPAWICDQIRPRIRPRQAADSIALLEELGMITFDPERQRHVLTQKQISTGDEIASLSVVRYHQQVLTLAKEAITDVDETERDISSIIVPGNSELVQKLKKEIQTFRKRMIELCDQCDDPDLILQLNLQLVPVTRNRRKKA